jgi:hypothetical protein
MGMLAHLRITSVDRWDELGKVRHRYVLIFVAALRSDRKHVRQPGVPRFGMADKEYVRRPDGQPEDVLRTPTVGRVEDESFCDLPYWPGDPLRQPARRPARVSRTYHLPRPQKTHNKRPQLLDIMCCPTQPSASTL